MPRRTVVDEAGAHTLHLAGVGEHIFFLATDVPDIALRLLKHMVDLQTLQRLHEIRVGLFNDLAGHKLDEPK